MKDPKFSVITVSFNHADFIRQTIESVLLQKYQNFEHIVVDGGSTDETIAILKAYPHLLWTSEPDRGQSHALNKGFAKASGDIIAWINSDDWYAPGIFRDVALALEEYPILLGACELTDKYGARKELYQNLERNWFDVLKYWIFHSSPSQPSIFFRRELLEQVKLAPGKYLDEDLDFCMDYDLWLRMCKLYPLARRIPRVFSYYRTYESNKTGEMMDVTYKEMSRVFQRHVNRICSREKAHSFVIPVSVDTADLGVSIQSLAKQTLQDLEVVVVDHTPENVLAKRVRREVIELGRSHAGASVRYVRATGHGLLDALQSSVDAVRAPLVSYIGSGDVVPSEYVATCRDVMSSDNLGIVLPFMGQDDLRQFFTASGPTDGQQSSRFKFESIFATSLLFPNFTARQALLKELGGFVDPGSGDLSIPLFFKQLLLRTMYKGWQITANAPLALPWRARLREYNSFSEQLQLYINAYLVQQAEHEFKLDPFAVTRLQHGFCIRFPEPVRVSADKLLQLAPKNWLGLAPTTEIDDLLAITKEAPHFAPGWFFLRTKAEAGGDGELIRRAEQGYRDAKSYEGALN